MKNKVNDITGAINKILLCIIGCIIGFVIFVLISLLGSASLCSAGALFIEEDYLVKSNDTVESIAEEYIVKNTYSERGLLEFAAGIRELNNILPCEQVKTGDVIKVTYWVYTEEE